MAPFPQQFLDSIKAILPAHLTLDDFIAYSGQPLRRSIRVNTLKISVDGFVELMSDKGWTLTPVPWCEEGFWLERDDESQTLGNTAEHLAGLFYIQEASSMMPPTALFTHSHAPQRVLDVASAPGSKTTQIAARLDNQGLLLANEYSSSRLKGLHANLSRLGIRNVVMTHFDGRVFGPALPEQFDAILLDAPCSGEGTIRKDPDAFANWDPESVEEIAELQRGLIESAFAALKPGGLLVYSTCTLNHRENQDVCQHLLDQYPDAVEVENLADLFPGADRATTDEGYLHVWPQIYDSEGFFVAALRKTASIDTEQRRYKLGKFPYLPAKRAEVESVTDYLAGQLGLSLPADGRIMARDSELWWFPEGLEHWIGTIRMDRMGLKLAETHKKGFKTFHEAAMALALDDDKAVALSDSEAEQYLMGRDVSRSSAEGKGEVVVTWLGHPLGLAKWVGSRLKNALPRELVRDKISTR
ncbi:16S rRNA (cytosine(1407)-C(5))-methyltransferase RsmF [Ferrimonas balearica]|uniref:16S rRNA (cytosine(1407)-C(5))-methyltransferase RsmF n=1 Tax=Ferrimonas balearica TaxID=44012 RepID=UPI001C5785E9|nr:16S rRNA (cytosine(1407)-C(5))-methyltransferase RsmF [Ferrimonas balearica]MBW3163430.1 16S rRNA (cytosine(1407)-C(5))-methyltransferase RsmF [Ferrimonas balearica]MBY6106040.1 16S rRNA (cytosine(1407)-C(5))-methyltransferase RsmF [Ferrimonas balearica]